MKMNYTLVCTCYFGGVSGIKGQLYIIKSFYLGQECYFAVGIYWFDLFVCLSVSNLIYFDQGALIMIIKQPTMQLNHVM